MSREIIPDKFEQPEIQTHQTVEQHLLEKEAAMRVHEVLHNLQEPYKEVFSLRVFGQLSFADIAGLFSKTESWARVTFHRARKMIGEKMRKEGYYE